MAKVDGDAVAFEDRLHLADDGGARGLDAVELQHGVNVVGEEPVRVDGALVVVHGPQVHARSHDDGGGYLSAGVGAAFLFNRIGAAAQTGNGLDDGGAASAFDEIEHEQFWAGGVVLGRIDVLVFMGNKQRGKEIARYIPRVGSCTKTLPDHQRKIW